MSKYVEFSDFFSCSEILYNTYFFVFGISTANLFVTSKKVGPVVYIIVDVNINLN